MAKAVMKKIMLITMKDMKIMKKILQVTEETPTQNLSCLAKYDRCHVKGRKLTGSSGGLIYSSDICALSKALIASSMLIFPSPLISARMLICAPGLRMISILRAIIVSCKSTLPS